MIPGPTKVDPIALGPLVQDYGAGYAEPEFFALYRDVSEKLQTLMETKHEIVIQSGEAMSILWGALKSTLRPRERLLAISTGLFGEGFADMARSFGVEAEVVAYGADETIHDLDRIESAIQKFKPKVITVVHCETPSGTLNPLKGLGQLKHDYQVPLLIVDAVSSIAATPIQADAVHADIVMGGSQKALSLPPTIGFCSVSPTAWEIIETVNYAGYEAFLPFKGLGNADDHPNTPDWAGIAALNAVLDNLINQEGLNNVYKRHETVAEFVREQLVAIGYQLFPKPTAIQSPSVTTVKVPEKMTFTQLNEAVRTYGLGIGSGMGALAGNTFRLGHMGSQATMENAKAALAVLDKVL